MKYLLFILIPILGFGQNDTWENCDFDLSEVILKVDESAVFIGGEEALVEYIKEHSPKASYDLNPIEGLYLVRFTITEKGDIQNICIERNIGGHDLDNEIIEMVANMPKWIPAKKDGAFVKSIYRIPVRIYLM